MRQGRSPALLVAALLSISYGILLPVVPVIAERRGVRGDAAAATAVLFVATVLAELLSPTLMSRFSPKSLAVVAMLFVGPPCLLYLSSDLTIGTLLVVTFVRGAGSGLATVVCLTLVAQLAAHGKRGAAIGLYGLSSTAPLVVMPSVGLILLGLGQLEIVVVSAAVVGTFGVIVALTLPRSKPEVSLSGGLSKIRSYWRPMTFSFLTLAIVNMSYGGVISFVPVVLPTRGWASSAMFLFVAGTTRTVGRLVSGVVVDRYQTNRVVLGGILSASLGLLLLPMGSIAVLLAIAGCLYGAGHGAVQTATYVRMAQRSIGSSQLGIVSALWNIGIDAGIAFGAAILGLVTADFGYQVVLWTLPLMVAAAIPFTLIGAREELPAVWGTESSPRS